MFNPEFSSFQNVVEKSFVVTPARVIVEPHFSRGLFETPITIDTTILEEEVSGWMGHHLNKRLSQAPFIIQNLQTKYESIFPLAIHILEIHICTI